MLQPVLSLNEKVIFCARWIHAFCGFSHWFKRKFSCWMPTRVFRTVSRSLFASTKANIFARERRCDPWKAFVYALNIRGKRFHYLATYIQITRQKVPKEMETELCGSSPLEPDGDEQWPLKFCTPRAQRRQDTPTLYCCLTLVSPAPLEENKIKFQFVAPRTDGNAISARASRRIKDQNTLPLCT